MTCAWLPGRAPRAELLQREHQLDRVEQADDAGELRRRQATREPDELGARDVDVDEHPGEREVVERHRLGGDLEIEAVRDDEAVDDVEVGGGAAVHARDDAVLDDELRLGSFGPFAATSPSSGNGETSCSSWRSRVARDAKRRLAIREQPSLGVRRRGLADERRRLRSIVSPRAARPTPRARRPSRAWAEAPCRHREADRRERRRARPHARGSRRAGPAPPARATSACSRSVSGVARISSAPRAPARGASSVTSRERTSAGRRDEIGPPRAEGVVTRGVEGHAAQTLGFAASHGQRRTILGKGGARHGRFERHRRRRSAPAPGRRGAGRVPRSARRRARRRARRDGRRVRAPATSAKPSPLPTRSSATSTCSSARPGFRAHRSRLSTCATRSGSA